MFTYFQGEDVYIYPSVNADDGGDLSSEKNLSQITENLKAQNFVVDRRLIDGADVEHNYLDVEVPTSGGMTFRLYSGISVIAGRSIKLENISSSNEYFTFNLSDMLARSDPEIRDMVYNFDSTLYYQYKSNIKTSEVMTEIRSKALHLYLVLLLDGTGNVAGDIVTPNAEIGTRMCEGVALVLDRVGRVNSKYYIDLGCFVPVANGTTFTGIYSYEESPLRYVYIDESSIRVGDMTLEEKLDDIDDIISSDTMRVSSLYITDNNLKNSEIIISSSGKVVPKTLFYTSPTSATSPQKQITPLNSSVMPKQGTTIKIRFSQGNKAGGDRPLLQNPYSRAYLPVYLQGLEEECNWWNIGDSLSIYELVYEESPASWVLLNPTQPDYTVIQQTPSSSSTQLYLQVDNWNLPYAMDNSDNLPNGFKLTITRPTSWSNISGNPNVVLKFGSNSSFYNYLLRDSDSQLITWDRINEEEHEYHLEFHQNGSYPYFEVLNPGAPSIRNTVQLTAFLRVKRKANGKIDTSTIQLRRDFPAEVIQDLDHPIRWSQSDKIVCAMSEEPFKSTVSTQLTQTSDANYYVYGIPTRVDSSSARVEDAYEYWYMIDPTQDLTKAKFPPYAISGYDSTTTNPKAGVAVTWLPERGFIKHRAQSNGNILFDPASDVWTNESYQNEWSSGWHNKLVLFLDSNEANHSSSGTYHGHVYRYENGSWQDLGYLNHFEYMSPMVLPWSITYLTE